MSDLIKVLIWPIVAVVALFMFSDTIKNQFQSGAVSKVKVGLLEIDLRAADLPSVSDPIAARGLAGISENSLSSLLYAERAYIECQGDSDAGTFEQETGAKFDELEARQLATLQRYTDDTGDACIDLELTPAGATARLFVLDLVAAQFRTATTE